MAAIPTDTNTSASTTATAPRPVRRLAPSQVDCKWWLAGYCSRGIECKFRHDKDKFRADKNKDAGSEDTLETSLSLSAAGTQQKQAPAIDSDHCSICYELPKTYGLLENCTHSFCLECLRDWRTSKPAPKEENDLKQTSKTCPMCRSHSDFIIPSSICPSTTPDPVYAKKAIFEGYMGQMKSIPCKHFEKSIKDTGPKYKFSCRFGNDCHYAHIHPITKEPYKLTKAEVLGRPRRRARGKRRELAVIPMDVIMEQRMLWELYAAAPLD